MKEFLVPSQRGVTVELNREIHDILKLAAMYNNCTQKQFVIRCIKDYLKKNRTKLIKEITFPGFKEKLEKFLSDSR